jgi:hypothetical protein
MMSLHRVPRLFAITTAVLLAIFAGSAQAELTLTAEGVSRGFKLTTFAFNFPTGDTLPPIHNGGAFGVLFTNRGLLVTDESDSSIRLIDHDCDGQDASKIVPTASYALPAGMAKVQLQGKPKYYLVTSASEVFQINGDGTPIRKVATIDGDFDLSAIAGDPHFETLIVTAPFCHNSFDCSGGIFFVDPLTGTSTEVGPGFVVTSVQVDAADNIFIDFVFFGAIWFNPDFSINSLFPLNFTEGSVLGTGALSDHIFQITKTGELWEQKLDGTDLTMIASGGDLAPLATADPHNGSLIFTNQDKVVRLSGGGLASGDGETEVDSCPNVQN